MRRTLTIVLIVCAAALGGWGAARVRQALLERKVSRLVEDRRVAAEAAAKIPAQHLAELIRETDEVVISYSGAKTVGEKDLVFRDPAWRAAIAEVIAKASFKPTTHGFWISTPAIRFNRNHEQVLELTGLGGILRAYGRRGGGDFIVEAETIRAIHALIEQKQPGHPNEPWRGYGL